MILLIPAAAQAQIVINLPQCGRLAVDISARCRVEYRTELFCVTERVPMWGYDYCGRYICLGFTNPKAIRTRRVPYLVCN